MKILLSKKNNVCLRFKGEWFFQLGTGNKKCGFICFPSLRIIDKIYARIDERASTMGLTKSFLEKI